MQIYATCLLLAQFIHGQKIIDNTVSIILPNLEISENLSQTYIFNVHKCSNDVYELTFYIDLMLMYVMTIIGP